MSDFRDLEYLADRARELLDRQVESFRVNQTKAGTLIGISSVFIPVFLFIIEKSPQWIQVLSVVPMILFVVAILMMMRTIRAKPLYQGFRQTQFDKLVRQDYEDILLYEIGAKKDSITDNQEITQKQNRQFNRGLWLTICALLFSFTLLISNLAIQNLNTMSDSSDPQESETPKESSPDTTNKKDRTIPSVPRDERMPLSEGFDPDIKSSDNTGALD